MITILKKYSYFIFAFLILLLGLVIRIKCLILNPSMWHDECALGWNIFHYDFFRLFGLLNFLQVASPFFMITAKIFTKVFGESDFSLRLVTFFFSTCGMFLFFYLTTQIFRNKLSILVSTFLFAINNNNILYSFEFKQYSCDIFFSTLCILLFYNLYYKDLSLKKIIIYSALLSLAIWFSFISIVIIVPGFLILLIKFIKEKNNFLSINKLRILLIPFCISGLLALKLYLITNYLNYQYGMNTYWADGFIKKDLSNLFSLLVNNSSYFYSPLEHSKLPLLLILVGGICLYEKKKLLTIFLVSSILFLGFISWLGFYPFLGRVILFLLPILYILPFGILETCSMRSEFKSAAIVGGIIFIFFKPISYTYECIFYNLYPTKGYHGREMMDRISHKIKKDDLIFVNSNSYVEFVYYSSFHKIKNKFQQEPPIGDNKSLIKSLKRGRNYWIFMPYNPLPEFLNWIYMHKNNIIWEGKEVQYGKFLGTLIYMRIP